MCACRADIEDGPDVLLDPIFLCDLYQRSEVRRDIVFVLRPRIVHQYLDSFDFRKPVVVPYIFCYMSIRCMLYACILSVDSGHCMSLLEE